MDLMANKSNEEGVEFLTLDFRDAFKQLHVMKSERQFLTGSAMNGFFVYNTVVRHWVWTSGMVPRRCMGHAQHSSMVDQ